MAPRIDLEVADLQPPPVVVTAPEVNTSATRHLSAGAYIDDEFCLTALREIYYQPKRIVAPSYGFDIVTVLGHCLRARRVIVIRDVLLVGLLVFASWWSVLDVVVILLTLLAVHVAANAFIVGRDSIRYLRESGQQPDNDDDHRSARRPANRYSKDRSPQPRGFRRVWLENLIAQLIARVFGVVLTYALFASVAAVLAVLVWHADLLDGHRLGLAALMLLGGLVASAFVVPVGSRVWSQSRLRGLRPGRTVIPPMATRRLAVIKTQLDGNTVVYSGHSPFVGSGVVLRRWDLAQRLVRAPSTLPGLHNRPRPEAMREFSTPPFTAREVSAYVRDHIAGLGEEAVPERRLPDLTASDKIFVAGTEIADLQPYTDEQRMLEIIRNPTAPQRHYLVFQVVSWRGELVTTVYVHVAVQGKSLYVELYVTGLLPCDRRFRVVDEVGGTGPKAVLRDAGHAVFAAPLLVASAPVNLVRACVDVFRLAFAADTGSLRLRKGYDYGARVGIRELGMSAVTRDHMQTQDIVKYGRVIERRVLAAILDFLEQHDVDVTEYRQRSLTILNAGAVAMDGGTVNVSGDAIGAQNTYSEGNGE